MPVAPQFDRFDYGSAQPPRLTVAATPTTVGTTPAPVTPSVPPRLDAAGGLLTPAGPPEPSTLDFGDPSRPLSLTQEQIQNRLNHPTAFQASSAGLNQSSSIVTAGNSGVQTGIGRGPLIAPGPGADNDDIERVAARVTARENARFDELYVPALRTITDRVNDTSIVDQAVADSGTAFGRADDQRDRNLSRQGLSGTAFSDREFERTGEIRTRLSDISDINTARDRQTERNESFQDTIVNIGRGFATNAQAGLNSAAGAATDRTNLNNQADAQESAARTQAGFSLASTIILVAAGL